MRPMIVYLLLHSGKPIAACATRALVYEMMDLELRDGHARADFSVVAMPLNQ